MHSLIVVSHPSPTALTHAVATEIERAITTASPANSVEIADLSGEGFDPRFSRSDVAAFNVEGPLADDARAEQLRIERAANLILVYPVYWWSMPGLLKGWIDRASPTAGPMTKARTARWKRSSVDCASIWLRSPPRGQKCTRAADICRR